MTATIIFLLLSIKWLDVSIVLTGLAEDLLCCLQI